MGRYTVHLPKFVFESNLGELLARLGEARRRSQVCFDFQDVKYYIPAAIVSVVATVNQLRDLNIQCSFVNYKDCEAFRYLQRIDLFTQVGLNLPEGFHRGSGSSDFIPVEKIESGTNTDRLSIRLGECIDPENGAARKLIAYASSEGILNCRQHSGAIGYVSAQYAAKYDLARIGVADCGCGILESFRGKRSTYYRPGMSDTDAIELALRPYVSSAIDSPRSYGKSPNLGIGLSMLQNLVRQTLGHMVVVSGTGWWWQDGAISPQMGLLPWNSSFAGTVCSIGFKRREIDDFNAMLEEARRRVKGLPGEEPDARLFA